MRLLALIAGLLSFFAVCALGGEGEKVLVPAGNYLPFFLDKSGKAEERKPVQVSSFWINRYPVTLAQYRRFVVQNPRWRKSRAKRIFADTGYLRNWKSDLDFGPLELANAPVTHVSWFAAKAYCESQGERLPTTDQWEYAVNDSGRNRKELNQRLLSWYAQPNPARAPSVGSTPKNGFGIYDLVGLIWEWTLDFSSPLAADGSGNENQFCGAGAQSARDASDYGTFVRFSFRNSLKADYTTANLGFRCVKNIGQPVE